MPLWKDKTVVIFGGSGFLGRYLVQRLARLGARLLIPTRDAERVLPLKPKGDVGQIVPLVGDVRDEAFLREAVRGADAVLNLIGVLYETGRQRFADVHAHFPGTLARIAAEEKVATFIHVSAIGADVQARAAYARTKGQGERAVQQAFAGATIIRPSLLIGAEDGFFNRFAAMAQLLPALPLIGGGKTKFQPVYVGDVANALVAALSYEGARGKLYEVGGPAVFTFRQLLELMMKETRLNPALIPLPFAFAKGLAFFLQVLPGKLLTPDQVEPLKTDNVVRASGPVLSLRALGITPKPIEPIVTATLQRYRKLA